ncbi:M23 family metallopeptidase [Sphingomonas hankyongi]|uniref:M23 family metallopeptidase n=1 Tax=Sphingomonas hankyongi TaxID=2908209 RepID=A0ABT0S4U2_9SPHN|nr:M23 family metallopeptidase [Sphingomonas hankyongi]MCL6730648.1 M23 family metallopeptidase [Sphingomonas hankyongi]
MLKLIGTALLTAFVTSWFWIWFYTSSPAASATEPNGRVTAAGDVATVDPAKGPPVAIAEGVEVGPAGLVIPVQGLKADQLTDTYTQARAGGARRHDAIDIMANEGTPVLAAADGTLEKLFYSDGGGGITAYVRSPDGRWSYYYAHLQGYAPGLKEGQQIKRGQFLGRVGHTGNANAEGPHLHFAINRMQQGERWWQGSPINPYPLLAGKKAGG